MSNNPFMHSFPPNMMGPSGGSCTQYEMEAHQRQQYQNAIIQIITTLDKIHDRLESIENKMEEKK